MATKAESGVMSNRKASAVAAHLILPRDHARRLVVLTVRYGTFIGLALWVGIMAFASDNFLTSVNLLNVARQSAPIILVGVGTTFVMATAGIDLSVGSIVALVSCVAASWLHDGISAPIVVAALFAIGGGVGCINGVLISLGLPAFIVTLGALVSIRGLAF